MRYQTQHLSSSELGEASFLNACQLWAHFTVFQQQRAIWLAGVWQCRRCLSEWKHWRAKPNLLLHTLLNGSTVVSIRASALSWKTGGKKLITSSFFFTSSCLSILLCCWLQLTFCGLWKHLNAAGVVTSHSGGWFRRHDAAWAGLRSRVSRYLLCISVREIHLWARDITQHSLLSAACLSSIFYELIVMLRRPLSSRWVS